MEIIYPDFILLSNIFIADYCIIKIKLNQLMFYYSLRLLFSFICGSFFYIKHFLLLLCVFFSHNNTLQQLKIYFRRWMNEGNTQHHMRVHYSLFLPLLWYAGPISFFIGVQKIKKGGKRNTEICIKYRFIHLFLHSICFFSKVVPQFFRPYMIWLMDHVPFLWLFFDPCTLSSFLFSWR